MTSSRPYLIRAIYEWITDNRFTPYILVNAQGPDVFVPREYINEDGRIVLNVSPDATHDFFVSNTELEFHASFSGISRHISAPIPSILAIYAHENGLGMFFGDEPGGETPPDNSKYRSRKEASTKKSHLKVIK